MKLLFDQNLSRYLVGMLQDIFPASTHVALSGLQNADDLTIWNDAKTSGFSSVTKDVDVEELSLLHGFPPKVVRITTGNCVTRRVENILRLRHPGILAFYDDPTASIVYLP